jgi:malonyl-CoA/methylmalonyl-CoA synthetase
VLLPPTAADRPAVAFPGLSMTHGDVVAAARAVADRVSGRTRVAVWATPSPETVIAVVGALAAGVAVVPLNPKVGSRELAHILADSAPELLLHAPGDAPDVDLPKHAVDTSARAHGDPLPEPDPESVAFVVYTSGTTGPPKGVLLPRRAVATNLDALAEIWSWTAEDVLVHGLPLFHVHGLIVGVLGPLRRGGELRHLGRFSSAAVGEAFDAGATLMFGVPTMYHRLGLDCADDPALAASVGRARLLVSGSAALPATDHARITECTGQRVVERYGMTETLMNCGVRADGERRPGIVGPALPGVEVRLAEVSDGMGELEVRGPNLFLGYLNRPDATEAAFTDGWFRTGDMAVQEPDGAFRIVGRRATDLIKSGGYKIGAGEIENALLEHPAVAEAAVTAEPDDDLGERIVAWVVPTGERPSPEALADHVAALLAPHKRPRVVHFLDALPRNDMGKVTKRALRA